MTIVQLICGVIKKRFCYDLFFLIFIMMELIFNLSVEPTPTDVVNSFNISFSQIEISRYDNL